MDTVTKEKFLTDFFHLLNSNQINYFVFGEYRCLPQSTGSSDLDVIVSNSDFQRLVQITVELINKYDIHTVSEFHNSNQYFYRFLYVNDYTYWGLQLDIYYNGLQHIGTDYYPVSNLLPHIIHYNEIRVVDLEKSFYVNFIKEILHTGKVKEKYEKLFFNQLDKNKYSTIKELTNLYGNSFVNEIVKNKKLKFTVDECRKLQSILFTAIHSKDLLHRIKIRISSLKRFFQKNPGYTIAVLGTDGSGKSTIINEITPILNEAFHNGIVYEHLRPNVVPELGVLLGKKKKSEQPVAVTDPHALQPSGIAVSLLRWGYYLTDYTFGYLKKVFPIIHTKSKVFIFDRYYYDYYIDQRRSRTSLPQWILRFGELFVPTPDLILCLGGDPQKIYERKPETSLEEVTRQVNILKSFCQKRKKAVWIDTCTTKEESVKQTMEAICEMMSKRFSNQEIK